MKLKASVDYGVRAVMYLAAKGDVCSSREISEEMSVPRDYLIQLALRLRNAGLIKARPGKNGGYVLAKAPSKITVRQIVDAFDGEAKNGRSQITVTKNSDEVVDSVRKMHSLVVESLNSYLDCITVQDLLDSTQPDAPRGELIAQSLEREASRLRK